MRRAAALALLIACSGSEPRGPCQPDPQPGELGTVCGFRNPEDVEWVPAAGVLLVSQMRHHGEPEPGSLAALEIDAAGAPRAAPRRVWPAERGVSHPPPADSRCPAPPEARDFAPHGLAAGAPRADGVVPVAVVAHGGREAVELFELRGRGRDATLRWRDCAPLPPGSTGNDAVLAPDGSLWVSDYQPARRGLRKLFYTIAGGLGLDTGRVLVLRPGAPWTELPGTRAANPNGVALGPGGGPVYLASTGSGDLRWAPLDGSGAGGRLALPGRPDNLSWSPRGPLLAASHTHGLSALRCRLGRRPCPSPWSLLEIDPEARAVRERLHHDGRRIGAVSSVAEVAGRFYLGAVYDDRIGVWRPARGAAKDSGDARLPGLRGDES